MSDINLGKTLSEQLKAAGDSERLSSVYVFVRPPEENENPGLRTHAAQIIREKLNGLLHEMEGTKDFHVEAVAYPGVRPHYHKRIDITHNVPLVTTKAYEPTGYVVVSGSKASIEKLLAQDGLEYAGTLEDVQKEQAQGRLGTSGHKALLAPHRTSWVR